MSAKRAKRDRVDRRSRRLYEQRQIDELGLRRARQVTWMVAAIALMPASLVALALTVAALGGW